MTVQICKGSCGRSFVYQPAEFLVRHYRDDYCKDCYIAKIERENEQLRARVAHYEKVLASLPVTY